jgi:hypothetical protein
MELRTGLNRFFFNNHQACCLSKVGALSLAIKAWADLLGRGEGGLNPTLESL